ncbi:hypothetical protein [Acetivibrio saccincola]|uniref:hypothetical protein n=1 Tax=Acetivibrio saccincola TaxID=1677857 RepID=UPI00131DA755|nr:hypothetical protein [Acetivibrio saccincola]
MTLDRIILIIILLWVFIRTISYGKWTWDKKNRLGAIVIYFVAIASLIIPVYTMFFRY